jgi:hypothetical protein
MALPEIALLKMAEMLGPTGAVHLPSDLWQSASYCSDRHTAHIKERSPAGIGVRRLANSEARIPAMRLRILPCLNLSAGRRCFLAAQNRKELPRAWEVVGHFRLCRWDVDRNP